MRWSGSDGYLGAFLTNNRFFVISTSSNTWKTISLRTDESEKGVVSLSPYIALLITENRAIAFDTKANQFVEVQFPIYDKLIATILGKYVALSRSVWVTAPQPTHATTPHAGVADVGGTGRIEQIPHY